MAFTKEQINELLRMARARFASPVEDRAMIALLKDMLAHAKKFPERYSCLEQKYAVLLAFIKVYSEHYKGRVSESELRSLRDNIFNQSDLNYVNGRIQLFVPHLRLYFDLLVDIQPHSPVVAGAIVIIVEEVSSVIGGRIPEKMTIAATRIKAMSEPESSWSWIKAIKAASAAAVSVLHYAAEISDFNEQEREKAPAEGAEVAGGGAGGGGQHRAIPAGTAHARDPWAPRVDTERDEAIIAARGVLWGGPVQASPLDELGSMAQTNSSVSRGGWHSQAWALPASRHEHRSQGSVGGGGGGGMVPCGMTSPPAVLSTTHSHGWQQSSGGGSGGEWDRPAPHAGTSAAHVAQSHSQAWAPPPASRYEHHSQESGGGGIVRERDTREWWEGGEVGVERDLEAPFALGLRRAALGGVSMDRIPFTIIRAALISQNYTTWHATLKELPSDSYSSKQPSEPEAKKLPNSIDTTYLVDLLTSIVDPLTYLVRTAVNLAVSPAEYTHAALSSSVLALESMIHKLCETGVNLTQLQIRDISFLLDLQTDLASIRDTLPIDLAPHGFPGGPPDGGGGGGGSGGSSGEQGSSRGLIPQSSNETNSTSGETPDWNNNLL